MWWQILSRPAVDALPHLAGLVVASIPRLTSLTPLLDERALKLSRSTENLQHESGGGIPAQGRKLV
jgi:hypothetical protein